MAPESFFEWGTLGTLTGATAAVVVVGNTARRLLKADSLWIPFLTSLVVVGGFGVASGNARFDVASILLVALNTCLLFCTALGANDTIVGVATPRPDAEIRAQGRRKVKLLQTWLLRENV